MKKQEKDINQIKEELLQNLKTNDEVVSFIKEHKLSREDCLDNLLIFNEFIEKTKNAKVKYKLSYVNQKVNLIFIENVTNYGIYYLEGNIVAKKHRYRLDDILDGLNNNLDKQKIITFLRDFPKTGVYLSGKNTIGKTTLLVAYANTIYERDGQKTLFIYLPSFIESLKNFSQNSQLINKVKNATVLIIDDIGSEKVSVWSRDEILLPILNYRLENELKTYFTSNFNIRQLEKKYNLKTEEVGQGKSIISRIKGLAKDFEIKSDPMR